MTVQEAFRHILTPLQHCLVEREGSAAANIIFEDIAGYGKTRRFAYGDRDITEFTLGRLDEAVRRVQDGEPVQYVTGIAPFYGMMLKVSPAVLIPRPETTMLVDKAVEIGGGRRDLRVLDIGTGSGCIAIALARNIPFAQVDAVDISEAALKVARENAVALKAGVSFSHGDIFTMVPVPCSYDIVISNPPYILEQEKDSMDTRVSEHEPGSALFDPTPAQPLQIYRAISSFAASALTPGGYLLLEINPLKATEIKEILQADGFKDVQIWRDQFGKERFACGCRKDSGQ